MKIILNPQDETKKLNDIFKGFLKFTCGKYGDRYIGSKFWSNIQIYDKDKCSIGYIKYDKEQWNRYM